MSISNSRPLEEVEADISALSERELIDLGPNVVGLVEEKMNHPDFVPRNSFSDKVSWWYENLKVQIAELLK